MRRISLYKTGIAAAMLGMIGTSAVLAATPAVDMGALKSAGNQTMSVTVALKLSDQAGAEALMQRLALSSDPLYGKFLTPEQVEARFGPSDADVQNVTAAFTAAGLTVARTSATTLSVTGSVSMLERMFQTSVHQFEIPAGVKGPAFSFRAAVSKPVVPAAIASAVQGVVGFSTKPTFHNNIQKTPDTFNGTPVQRPTAGQPGDLSAKFGNLTVLDFDSVYDVNPLIAKGVNGAGRTIGIVTLASFTTSDVFFYWNSLGLKVDPNRISIVNVDGGSGPISDAAGSDETTLDVAQSGGIATGAKIVVYEAPNTNQAFVDAFAQAVHDNRADSISTSFGEPEIFDDVTLGGTVTDPFDGEQVSTLQAMHELFVVAALQGQSLFSAAGDSGAFDTVRDFGQGDGFTTPLSVDYPASDPAMTAAGGTTLPGPQMFNTPGGILTIDNPVERVWGWDYLEPLCNALGVTNFFQCGIFSVGTGGGVSSFFPIPQYQLHIPGTRLTEPGQTFTETDVSPPVVFFNFPAHFAGRNVPDVSFNADPETGYVVDYTSSVRGFGQEHLGGTSFVAPQLNGVTALLGQKAGHRLGLLNVELYNLRRFGFTFERSPVIRTISTGDNWFYDGRHGYAPASGVGTLDVFMLSEVTH
jgi:subtilase family serine protease